MSKEPNSWYSGWLTLPAIALGCVVVSFVYDATSPCVSQLDLDLSDRAGITELTGRDDLGSALVLVLAGYKFSAPVGCREEFWADLFHLLNWLTYAGEQLPVLLCGSRFAEMSSVVRDVCLEREVEVSPVLVRVVSQMDR